MALSIWTQQSGYKFNAVQERTIVNQQLPVSYGSGFDDSTSLNFKVISGKLPTGLRLENDVIVGTPYEVPRPTEFEFVIRASYNNQIADRTFFWTVEGQDEPTWETAAGALPLGANDQYYILDSSYIDFQLQVTDFDTAAGQELKFFQPKNGGQLPPGLILTRDGRLVGWIQPALAIPEAVGNGAYDTAVYDTVAYDFGYRPTNGYDSYLYDLVFFDFIDDNKTVIQHIGLVIKVGETSILCAEGNSTNDAKGSQFNGGEVCLKTRKLGPHFVVGFGRPSYKGAKHE